MTKKKTIVAVVAAAGVLATTATAGASEWLQQVTGILNGEVSVVVNGEKTELVPVYIEGTAYVPVREAAADLGYEVSYDDANKIISLKGAEKESANEESADEEAPEYMRGTGMIADIEEAGEDRYRIEFLGKGSNGWVILYADEETAIADQDGNAVSAADLKAGTEIVVQYGPIMTMSFPGQLHAAEITVVADRLVKEGVVQSAERTDDGWQVRLGETSSSDAATSIVLNAGKETSVMTPQGEPVKWEELEVGMNVRAYYGPIMTKSLPPISPLYTLVVLPEPQGSADGSSEE